MPLDWPMCNNIIGGIARGLFFLLQNSRQRIIHRDLKAGNVLLDNEMNDRISDFGLARSFGEKETIANTKRVYSIKSDVLEIVSGKKNRGFSHPDHLHKLVGHVSLLIFLYSYQRFKCYGSQSRSISTIERSQTTK
ncbi:hypothetical protein GQ457_02G031870 [Hibiscus cannabinus]